jgi:hypothetical protein
MSGCCTCRSSGYSGMSGVSARGLQVLDEGVLLSAAQFTQMNFLGDGVQAVDGGEGLVDVTIRGGILDPSRHTEYFDDFLGNEKSTFGVTGTGSHSFGMLLGANRPGTVASQVAAVGDSTRISLGGNANIALYFGGGLVTLEFVHNIPILSSPGNAFLLRDGFGDLANADYTDGVYLEYDFTTYGDHVYRLCTARNGVRTKVTTGIAAVQGQTRKIILTINAAGTLVSTTIDGVAGANTLALNIPNSALRVTQVSFQMIKQAGAVGRAVIRDYYWLKQTFTTPR